MARNRRGDDDNNNSPFHSSSVFPSSLARVHYLQRTPWIAIIITMVIAMLAVGFSLGNISGIANTAVFGIFLVYASVNLCLIWFRFKKPSVKRPFLSPLNIGKFPILSLIGLLTSIIILFQFNFEIIKGGFLVLLTITILCLILNKNKNLLRIFHRRDEKRSI
jgi:amino acid transporter